MSNQKFLPFITPHCHVRSFDAASSPEKFAQRFAELETGYFPITDHGTLEGTRQIYDLTKDKKQKFTHLKPILGLEGYFRDDNDPILLDAGAVKDEKGTLTEYFKYAHITLHAADEKAYSSLSRMLSAADLKAETHGSQRKPLFNWSDLEELGQYNITGTSGCLIGMVSRLLMEQNDTVSATRYYEKLRSLFRPGQFYVEIFPHQCDRNWETKVIVTDINGVEHRFPDWKKVKTLGEPKGIVAKKLAEAFHKDPVCAIAKHTAIVEVMHNRKWTPVEAPLMLKGVRYHDGWLYNECRPWCPEGDVQLGANRFLLELATKHGDPVLISDDSHMAYAEEKIAQDIRLGQNGSWKFANTHNVLSSDDAWLYFKNVMGTPQAQFESWIENSRNWASRFDNFKFTPRQSLPTSFYPQDTLKHALELIQKHGRMDWTNKEQTDRLKLEIELLHKNGTIDLLSYFFSIEELVREYAKKRQLTGPGRGSAAGLWLTYLLSITHAHPLKHKLSMDRFMTLDRIQTGKLPDIDQDLPSRDILTGIDGASGWLQDRFGKERVARISTETTLKLKSAIKDVFRVLEKQKQGPYAKVPEEIEALCKLLPDPPQGINDKDYVFGYEDTDGVWNQGLIETNAVLQLFVQKYPNEWKTVQLLLGLVRQKSQHPCAFIISNTPIDEFIPMQTIKDARVTSFTHTQVEAAGGLKMDFLVVNVLKDIQGAMELIARHTPTPLAVLTDEDGIDFVVIDGKKVPHFRVVVDKNGGSHDIWALPEDKNVFTDICHGKVESVFQLSGAAARQGLKNFIPEEGKPLPLQTIDGLAAFTALDRPGPLDAFVESADGTKHNMLVEYANRAKGINPIGDLPILNELLPETYGTIVFQEQLQYIFQKIGRTTAIEADQFRQRISKKKMVDVNKIDKPLFMKGASLSLTQDVAEVLWSQMETFGQYGFNKSHAVCYMYIAYACSWLKHHYPLEWWTSVLCNTEDRNKINEKHWAYCGHLIDLPDIKFSKNNFDVQNGRIRAPLSLLKGLGDKAHAQLSALAPYTNIDDLLFKIEEWKIANKTTKLNKAGVLKSSKGRSALNNTIFKNLIVSGAFNSLFPDITDDSAYAIPSRLAAYEDAVRKATGSKGGKKGANEGTTAALANPQVLYQSQKDILPAFSRPLEGMVRSAMPEIFDGNSIVTTKGSGMYEKKTRWSVINGKQFEALKAKGPISIDLTVSILAYVVGERHFSYTHKESGETRHAVEISLDMDGYRETLVKWGGEKGLSAIFKKELTGAIVACLFSRRASTTDWYFADMQILAPKLEKPKKEVKKKKAPKKQEEDAEETITEESATESTEEPEENQEEQPTEQLEIEED